MPVKEKTYRLSALLILFVFGISLMPRQVLHNVVTNHKHEKYAGFPGQSQLSYASFTCDTEDVFLQQSFYGPLNDVFPVALSAWINWQETPVLSPQIQHEDYSARRGPPAMI